MIHSPVRSPAAIDGAYTMTDYLLSLDNCVGMWEFTDTSGTTSADLSGNGNVATYVGSPTVGVYNPDLAKPGVHLNGSTQFISLGQYSEYPKGSPDSDLSFVVVHVPDAAASGVLLGKYAVNTGIEYQIAVDSDGGGVMRVGSTDNAPDIPNGTFQMQAVNVTVMTHDSAATPGTDIKLYHNGSLVTQNNRGTVETVAVDLLLGSRRGTDNTGSGAWYEGSLFIAAVFSDVLTPTEIQTLSNYR